MVENTKIEWAHHTFNPWMGCSKVSEGCKHCYAEAQMDLRYGKVQWGPEGTRVRTSVDNWNKVRRWNQKAKEAGERHRVFCASLADIFEDHPSIDINWRDDLFELIDLCRNLDWLLLTKRPQFIKPFIAKVTGRRPEAWFSDCNHVWVGTSVENEAAARMRIPHLLEVPARIRFLSCEPLLGKFSIPIEGIHWVIVGGESGPHARPMHPEWATSLLTQCSESRIPFFFKQWGEWQNGSAESSNARVEHTICLTNGTSVRHPNDATQDERNNWSRLYPMCMAKVGKKAAGRLLFSRTWDEVPA